METTYFPIQEKEVCVQQYTVSSFVDDVLVFVTLLDYLVDTLRKLSSSYLEPIHRTNHKRRGYDPSQKHLARSVVLMCW